MQALFRINAQFQSMCCMFAIATLVIRTYLSSILYLPRLKNACFDYSKQHLISRSLNIKRVDKSIVWRKVYCGSKSGIPIPIRSNSDRNREASILTLVIPMGSQVQICTVKVYKLCLEQNLPEEQSALNSNKVKFILHSPPE